MVKDRFYSGTTTIREMWPQNKSGFSSQYSKDKWGFTEGKLLRENTGLEVRFWLNRQDCCWRQARLVRYHLGYGGCRIWLEMENDQIKDREFSLNWFSWIIFFSSLFLQPHLWHMEVLGLKDRNGAPDIGLCHSHSNTGSEPHLWPIPQLVATHLTRPGMEPASSQTLCQVLNLPSHNQNPWFSRILAKIGQCRSGKGGA